MISALEELLLGVDKPKMHFGRYLFNKKYILNIQLLSLLTFSLCISSQQADYQTNLLKTLDSNNLNNWSVELKANEFVNNFIQPMMTGAAYDLNISNIQLLSEYQNQNPIKCNFDGLYPSNCLDEVTYINKFDTDFFHKEPNTNIILPFDLIAEKNNIIPSKAIIIQFEISLKSKFKEALIEFLEQSNSGKDTLRYTNLPDRKSSEWSRNNYQKCNNQTGKPSFNHGYCISSLAKGTGILDEFAYMNWHNSNSYVIDFVDRQKKQATYYNLAGFRQALVDGRKNRFLVDICETIRGRTFFKKENQMSEAYINSEYVQFDDISVVIKDDKNFIIKELIINTHQMTDRLTTSLPSGADITYGIELKNNHIFTYRLGADIKNTGTNILLRNNHDHLGEIGTIGHLITDRKGGMENACSSNRGHWMQFPSFSIVSNYEYNLIIPLKNSEIGKVNNVEIKYVPGLSSNDKQTIIR